MKDINMNAQMFLGVRSLATKSLFGIWIKNKTNARKCANSISYKFHYE